MNEFRLTNRSSFDLILCIVSVCLVFLSPSTYSYEYCLLIHNLFLLTFAYNTYKNRRQGLLSFNFLFSISLYFTSFVYPVFFYNTGERYFSMFSYSFNEGLISYSTAIAYMAYCFLQLGLNKDKVEKKTIRKKREIVIINSETYLNALSFVFFVLLIYFFVNDGLSFFANQFIYSITAHDVVMGYIVQLITPIAYAMLFLAFYLPNKSGFSFLFSIGLVVIYVLSILSTGSRTIPLSIIIMALFLFNDKIKKIGVTRLALLGGIFIVVLSLAGALRGEGELISTTNIAENASNVLNEKSENYFSFANELIICNRNLYYLIQSTQEVGYTFGFTLLGSLLSMVPFLRSLFMTVTGIPEYMLNSALYNTVLSIGLYHNKGLGTHAVADIYLCWGIIGVMLIFYLYGYVITKLKNRQDNIYYKVAYYIILSNAVYASRASIFNLNQIVWTILVIYFVLKMSGRRNLTDC